MDAAGEGFGPLIVYLKDVQKYLDNNLTQEGVASIGDLIVKATADGNAVIGKLDAALQASEQAALLIIPATPPAEAD